MMKKKKLLKNPRKKITLLILSLLPNSTSMNGRELTPTKKTPEKPANGSGPILILKDFPSGSLTTNTTANSMLYSNLVI